MTSKATLLTIISILCLGQVFCQDVKSDSISKTKIIQLEFLTGNWRGTGWMMDREGKKNRFDQTEAVQFKLDSTAILIEGLGKVNEQIVHNAMAIISYNKRDRNFSFHSYLQNGSNNKFKGELSDGKFYWYPNDNTRFIIWINDKKQWCEKGEYNQGDHWFQFFEMTLDKKQD